MGERFFFSVRHEMLLVRNEVIVKLSSGNASFYKLSDRSACVFIQLRRKMLQLCSQKTENLMTTLISWTRYVLDIEVTDSELDVKAIIF